MGKIIKNGIVYGGGGGGSGSGHTIMDTNGNFMPAENNLQFIGLDVTDNSSDGITEVESATLNQDSLDDIMSAGAAGNQVAGNGLVYSTTEQVVGKWVDGKPIYQKTVALEVPSNSSGGTSSVSVPGLDIAVSVEGVFLANNGGAGAVDYWMSCSRYNAMFTNTANTCICWATDGSILFRNFSPRAVAGSTAYVTARYTKTS